MADVEIKLTKEEALVLFEFLSRFSETDILVIDDQAEARALWNLNCLLEEVLIEPLQDNYDELVSEAYSRLRDHECTNGEDA